MENNGGEGVKEQKGEERMKTEFEREINFKRGEISNDYTRKDNQVGE